MNATMPITNTERKIIRIQADPTLTKQDTKQKRKNVAAYCRVSTEQEEQQDSYEAEVSYYTESISKNKDWNLVGIFADEGKSDTMTKKRDDFNRMIKLCEQGKIDLILTKSISRFARNTVDCLNYVRKLKELGIAVVFEKEKINTLNMESEVILSMLGVFAQAESESISKNVKWGIRQRMQSGTFAFNYSTLGYRKGSDGKPEIVPEEAEIVKFVFDSYLNGESVAGIAKNLEARKIKTKTGKEKWCYSIILAMLSNEKYVGDLLMQKTYVSDFLTKKVNKNMGELPKYLISNNHPAIIDRETFNLVQEERARRSSKKSVSKKTKTEKGSYKSKYALTECLVCGNCGTNYKRVTWDIRGTKKVVWRCANRIDFGKKYCGASPSIEEESLHRAICKALNKMLNEKEQILSIMKSTISYSINEDDTVTDLYMIQMQINQLMEKMKTIAEQIVKSKGNTDELQKELVGINSQLSILRERLKKEESKQKNSDIINTKLERIIKMLENEDFEMQEFDNIIIRKLIDKITVLAKDKIKITLKGGYETTAVLE